MVKSKLKQCTSKTFRTHTVLLRQISSVGLAPGVNKEREREGGDYSINVELKQEPD